MNRISQPGSGEFVAMLALASVFTVTGARAGAGAEETPTKYLCYVGTYTSDPNEGIARFILDTKTGEVSAQVITRGVVNPSFLAIHPSRKFLYAVAEVEDMEGKKTGGVRAFAIDPRTGALEPLNEQISGGPGPCHLTVDGAGKNVLVANYGGGSAAVLPIQPDGSLGKISSFVQHEGSSVNKQRQEGPHAHSINLDAASRFAFVADLGLDKVLIYRFDPEKGTLEPNNPPAAMTDPGAGPRHFTFHPNGKFAYVINEMALTVTAMRYDAQTGKLEPFQTISTVPAGIKGDEYSTAEVLVHPSGKFLYGSNRGHHSIARFAIDEATGSLTFLGTTPTGGKTPRNFALDPTGSVLLAENQDSGTIVLFRVDPKTGDLTPTGTSLAVTRPVCIRMIPWTGD